MNLAMTALPLDFCCFFDHHTIVAQSKSTWNGGVTNVLFVRYRVAEARVMAPRQTMAALYFGYAGIQRSRRRSVVLAQLGDVANAPRVLLADEPTGNFAPTTADHVFDTLTSLVKASRVAAFVAADNLDLAARMDRRATLRDGLVEELG